VVSTDDKIQGAFTGSMADLVTYRYVGSQSVVADAADGTAVGITRNRRHLCTPGSVSATALAVSMMDTAGIVVDAVQLLSLTEVDLHLYEPALDVERIRTAGRVVRWGRTQVFTECRFEDADRDGRVLGIGAANWSVMAPTPPGFAYTDPGPGLPDDPTTPHMVEAFGLVPDPDGGFVLPALSPRVGAELLHHGPMLVGMEYAALEVAARAAGTDALPLRSWTMRIVRAGRAAPFRARAEVLAATGRAVGCRSVLTDGHGDTIALTHVAFGG
jgi:acyl-coenzyme A thioesterase PaaI-like protein